MKRYAMTGLGLILALSALGQTPQPHPPAKPKELVPRKFTDARKAEAQAKRERKAAKRRKGVGK